MLGDDSAAQELVGVLHDIKKTMTDFKERRNTAQEIHQHVNVGGHAVWVVVVMAAVIFTAAILQGPRISTLERKVDRLEDYLSAIYQQAPGLREKVEADVNNHHHNKAEGSEQKR